MTQDHQPALTVRERMIDEAVRRVYTLKAFPQARWLMETHANDIARLWQGNNLKKYQETLRRVRAEFNHLAKEQAAA